MAVLQKGSFVLSEGYRHLQVPLNKGSEMTSKQKKSYLAKVDVSAKENPTVALSLEDQAPSTSEAREPVSCTIGTFEDSKLPECLPGSWVNAYKIVDLQGMANHPIDPTKRTVISLGGSTTHTVKMGTQKKQLYCDEFCPRFKEVAICAHMIAVTHNEGRLSESITSYKLPVNRPSSPLPPARPV